MKEPARVVTDQRVTPKLMRYRRLNRSPRYPKRGAATM